jgi:RNA polymerase sigma factor (sigma-70 family)
MPATRTNETSLVVAAQAGDRRALDDLVARYLPLVYTIALRALNGDPDVDDVVQEVMFRALRDLPALRAPESFRPWLAAITVRQVSTHLHRRRISAEHRTALDDVADVADADSDFTGFSVLRLELADQRRQVERASRWLDADDRTLASLWWLETAGHLTRTELATAADVSVAHAGVRIQRMRGQLDLARSVVAALDSSPRCAGLQAALTGWDGRPSPVWRKRLARHTRSCPVCRRAMDGLAPTERLLLGSVLLAVPVGLGPALVGKGAFAGMAAGSAVNAAVSGATGAGIKAGILGQLVQAVAAHPIVAAITAGTVAAAAAGTVASLPAGPPQTVTAAPPVTSVALPPTPTAIRATPGSPSHVSRSPATASSAVAGAGKLALGPASLESVNETGLFVTTVHDLGVLAPVRAGTAAATRQGATFVVVSGLADADCFSFRARDGRYLRHSSWRLRLSRDEGTPLFRGDATFCPRAGSVAGSIQLVSSNYPGYSLRHRGDELWVDPSNDTAAFRADSSFRVRPALAG